MNKYLKKSGVKLLIISLWLLIWQLIHLAVNSKILMAGPKETFYSLKAILLSDGFFPIVINSSVSILYGLFMAVILSLLLSVISYNISIIKEFLKPLITLMKSIPVACFVILALLWTGSAHLSLLIVFIIAFPILYSQLLDGFTNMNNDKKEMAKDFHFTFLQKLIYVYIPSVFNAFVTSICISVGMSFKAGIAAEVIGQPPHSIGEQLYFAKLYLESGTLFAWTLVILLLSVISEKIIVMFLLAVKNIFSYLCIFKSPVSYSEPLTNTPENLKTDRHNGQIILKSVCKSFNDTPVIPPMNITISSGDTVAIIGQSGSGKTTLFNIIAKKISPDSGEILSDSVNMSVLYQNTCLLDYGNGIFNVAIVQNHISDNRIKKNISLKMLSELLSEKDFIKPVKFMSGGMKRRVEIVRAFAMNSDIILLDEPFSGLDMENRLKVAEFIKKYQGGRSVVVTLHSKEEAELLSPASIINL